MLYIHIGAHKTGTTTIQHTLAHSAEALAERRLVYPRVCWFHYAQHRLAFAMKKIREPGLRDFPDFETELRDLIDACLSTDADVLISSEEFFSAPAEGVSRLADVLRDRGIETRIVGFIRRQDALFSSIYNQNVKHPGNRFTKPAQQFVERPRALSRDLDLWACLRNWAEAFGKDRVTVCLYEAGDSLVSLCNAIGRPDMALPNDRRINSSVSPSALELVRLAKVAGAEASVQRRVLTEAQKVFPAVENGRLLSREQARRVLAEFEEDNRALFAAFGLGANAYAPDALEREEWAEERPLTNRKIGGFIAHLAGALRD